MSNGGHPPSLFGYGPVGIGDINPVASEASASQMVDPNDMMPPMIDSTMMDSYGDLPMGPDTDDLVMGQPFAGPPSLSQADDASLIGDDLLNNASAAAATSMPAFGSTTAGSSQVTEFTKRRNWPAKIMEEIKDFIQVLDTNGRIRYVSPALRPVTGYAREEVLDRFLRDFLHPDDVGVFVAELNDSIATGSPMRVIYRFRKKDGSYEVLESVGHGHIAAAAFAPNPNNQSPFCQAVFIMSRRYPLKNAGLLESFLDHKIENERLQRRIAELKKEEAEDAADSQHTRTQITHEGRSDVAPSEDTAHASVDATAVQPKPGVDSTMPPPDRPASFNTALTRENLEGIAGNRPDSIRDKMARYEGVPTHADTIEKLTGLRYQEGERSQGITTGSGSPKLIKGDAGIAIPMDRDPRAGDKKKKAKLAEEYVCTDCGTLDSPEWRKGPSGPKTLCNACGLRWAKKEKKKSASTAQTPAVDSSG